jgi:signal transduction histidine kinase
MMAELDIQGYHDKADGPDKLLLWVDVGLKAHRLVNKLRDRERLQRELVANVSHELRTPLHIIGGYTDLLLQGQFGTLPDEAEKPLRHIALATDNLAELVSDLLKYNKLEAGVADGTQQWMSLDELSTEMARLASLLLDEKEVSFSLDMATAPAGLMTDAVKLRTILRNLLANAVKFTSHGAITLRVAMEVNVVSFALTDTGTGIAAEHQELIFEPFRQVDGSSTRRYGGIGLGLALSRKLARILGGDLRVASQLGAGSTFTLSLPSPGTDAQRDASASEIPESALMSVGDAA